MQDENAWPNLRKPPGGWIDTRGTINTHIQLRNGCYLMLLSLFHCSMILLYIWTDKQWKTFLQRDKWCNMQFHGSRIAFWKLITSFMDCVQPLFHYDDVLSLFTANRGGLSAESVRRSHVWICCYCLFTLLTQFGDALTSSPCHLKC